PVGSKARLVRWLLAMEPGSRTIARNWWVARSKRRSPASVVAHHTASSATSRSLKSRARRWVCHAPSAATHSGSQTTAQAAARAGASPRARRVIGSVPAAHEAHQAQPPDHADRFPDDAAAHLGNAGATIHEHDGDLADLEPALPALERHLDLERIAVGADPLEPDPLQGPAAEALEAAGRVVHRQAGDQTSVHVGGTRKDEAIEGPVDHPDAVQVARP